MRRSFCKIMSPVKFFTTTVVDWVDVFTRREYCDIIIDSLNYCIKEKGLVVYAWVLMTNHIHLIADTTSDDIDFGDIIRDFKKFTAKKLVRAILDNPQESRREWLTQHFLSDSKSDHFWQNKYDSIEINNIEFLEQKLNYIHNNPVKAGIVDTPADYRYSSACDYAGSKGLVNIELINFGFKTY